MEQDNLFFIRKAKSFRINQLGLSVGTKTVWEGKCRKGESSDLYRRWVGMLSEIVGFYPGIKILDVGCGVGAEAIELSYLGAECTGLDASEGNIQLINQVAADFSLNVNGVYGDACKLPFKDGSFDVVISFEFFEHVASTDHAMAEQLRVLKSGGKLVIEQANLLNPLVLFDLLIKYPIRSHGKYGGIKWLFTKSRVRQNLYGIGWDGRDEDIHTRLWWIKKLKRYPSIYKIEITSSLGKMRGKVFKLLEPLIGNIIISATKC